MNTMPDNNCSEDGTNRHWQKCEIPECRNEVPTAKGICDECEGGWSGPTDGKDRWRKARKRPVIVEFRGPYSDTGTIETIEGDFEVDEEYIDQHDGYVIIRGVEGEVYPCGLDIFHETYEQVENRSVDTGKGRGAE